MININISIDLLNRRTSVHDIKRKRQMNTSKRRNCDFKTIFRRFQAKITIET